MRLEQSKKNPEWYHVVDSQGKYVLCNVSKSVALKYMDKRKRGK